MPICLLRILFVKQGRDGSPGPVGQPGIPGEKVKYRNCQIFKTCLRIVLSDEKKNTQQQQIGLTSPQIVPGLSLLDLCFLRIQLSPCKSTVILKRNENEIFQ